MHVDVVDVRAGAVDDEVVAGVGLVLVELDDAAARRDERRAARGEDVVALVGVAVAPGAERRDAGAVGVLAADRELVVDEVEGAGRERRARSAPPARRRRLAEDAELVAADRLRDTPATVPSQVTVCTTPGASTPSGQPCTTAPSERRTSATATAIGSRASRSTRAWRAAPTKTRRADDRDVERRRLASRRDAPRPRARLASDCAPSLLTAMSGPLARLLGHEHVDALDARAQRRRRLTSSAAPRAPRKTIFETLRIARAAQAQQAAGRDGIERRAARDARDLGDDRQRARRPSRRRCWRRRARPRPRRRQARTATATNDRFSATNPPCVLPTGLADGLARARSALPASLAGFAPQRSRIARAPVVPPFHRQETIDSAICCAEP